MLVAEGHNVLVVNGAGSPYKSVADRWPRASRRRAS